LDSGYKKLIDSLDKRELKEAVSRLKRANPRTLDHIVHPLHNELFESIDCLKCAACCSSLGPAIKDVDIQRMAKHLKIKPSELTEKYLKVDEDIDYVFKTMPCPFLQDDNICSVYESRPMACREYPHTDRKNFYQIIDLSMKNVKICPVVAGVFQKISEKLK
jgi:Fe-S-cluster containining protein